LNQPRLLDHLVDACQHGRGHVEAERFGGLEILAREDTVDVTGGAAKLVDVVNTVGDQAVGCYEGAEVVSVLRLSSHE
jgi:hypothetical protein